MFEHLLPRHLEIIFEINDRFLQEVRERFPGDDAADGARLADRRKRRAPHAHGALSIVGSHRVNGVSAAALAS